VEPQKVKIADIEQLIVQNCNSRAPMEYGIEVKKMGFRRINYPSIVAEAVYNRMRAEREKEAKKFRAEGTEEASKIEAETDRKVTEILARATKESEIIKGEGDRDAMKIYADAYGQDREFFEFRESLKTYEQILKTKSTLVLSTDSELFKYLNSDKVLK
ncbi:protease modulator HflC, partial [candidate division CSSED10-310 bacterium]